MMRQNHEDEKPQHDFMADVDPKELQEYIDNGLDGDGNYARILKSLGGAATKNGA